MPQCDYCPGSFSRSKIGEHKRKCFQEHYFKPTGKRQKQFSQLSHTPQASPQTASEQQLTYSQQNEAPHESRSQATIDDQSRDNSVASETDQVTGNRSQGVEANDVDYDFDYGEDPVGDICGIHHDFLSDSEVTDDSTRSSNLIRPENHYCEPGDQDRQLFDKVGSITPTLNPSETLSLQLLHIIDKYNISVAAHKELVAFTNDAITMSNEQHTDSQSVHFYQVFSPYLTENLLTSLYPVKKREYDICSDGCYLYMSSNITTCPKTNCNKPRYRNGTEKTTKEANAKMAYLPLSEQLATFVMHKKTRDLLNHRSSLSLSNDRKTDIFDGSALQNMHWDCHNIALAVYIDGFQPFIHSTVSMTIVHVVIMNLPPMERYKHDYMLQVSIIPTGSKEGNLDYFIAPLIHELKQLESTGTDVKCDDGSVRSFKAHLILATGDIPACASIAHHGGHTSGYPCRICIAPSVRLESPKSVAQQEAAGEDNQMRSGYGQYLPGRIEMDPLRTLMDFRNGDEAHNIQSPSPFAQLASFTGPFFYGCDEMHLYGCNVGPHIWAMLTNPTFNTPFLLSKSQKAAVSAALKRSSTTWPAVFDGKITNVLTSAANTRAIDYIDLLLYVFPTIIIEQLETAKVSETSISALANLVKAVALSLSWSVTEADIQVVERCTQVWHLFAINDLPHNIYRVSMHYLRHVPELLRQLGPMHVYSARCMERAVGLFDRRIKSSKESGTNAGNTLVTLAARRYLDRSGVSQTFGYTHTTQSDDDLPDLNPDIWGPHLSEKMTTDSFKQHYNLMLYIRKFWARVRNVQDTSLPPLSKKIKVGKRLFLDKCTYDCTLPLGSRNHGTYLMLSLPVNENAHGGLLSGGDSVDMTYFGEAILFFEHEYLGDTRILCLVRLASDTQLTSYGYPFGKCTVGSTGRYYVCNASEIVCAVGILSSPSKPNRWYYVFNDMVKKPILLGKLKDI